MCETETLRHLHQVVSVLSETAARQVLAFAESLQSSCPPSKILSPKDETRIFAELRARAEARPLSSLAAGEFMRRIRDEARY